VRSRRIKGNQKGVLGLEQHHRCTGSKNRPKKKIFLVNSSMGKESQKEERKPSQKAPLARIRPLDKMGGHLLYISKNQTARQRSFSRIWGDEKHGSGETKGNRKGRSKAPIEKS